VGGGRRGRKRDPRVDAVVLQATRDLLIEVGYSALTFEAIARKAGVHRPAIYRRWRTKAELVHDAVYPADAGTLGFATTGDFARDLRLVAQGAIALFSRREVLAAVPGMMADRQSDASLQRRLQPRVEAAARKAFAAFVADAAARGVAYAPVDPDVLLDALAGTVLMRVATRGRRALAGLEDELTLLLVRAAGAANGPAAARGIVAARATRGRSRVDSRGRTR